MRSPVHLSCALVVLSSACGGPASEAPPPSSAGKQSFAEAIRMICDVDRMAGLSADEDPLGIGQKRTDWIAEHVENADGIYLRTVLSVKGPEEQAKDLRAEAGKLGLGGCALADSIEQHAAGGLSP